MMKLTSVYGIAILALTAVAAGPARATVYTYTQLPFRVGGLNDVGQIIGSLTNTPYFSSSVAALYDHGTVTYPLGQSGFANTFINPTGINNMGLVTYNELSGNSGGASEFKIGSSLANPPFIAAGSLNGINNKGDVVGTSGPGFAIINGQTTSVFVPPQLPYDLTATQPLGINDLDQIVGFFIPLVGSTHYTVPPNYYSAHQGFLLSGGVYTTFRVPGSAGTDPVAINNSDEIVGTYTDATGAQHGFEDRNNVFSTIVGPNGGDFLPTGLNNLGQIVGRTSDGVSFFGLPQTVPEPSSLMVLCAGVMGLLGWRIGPRW